MTTRPARTLPVPLLVTTGVVLAALLGIVFGLPWPVYFGVTAVAALAIEGANQWWQNRRAAERSPSYPPRRVSPPYVSEPPAPVARYTGPRLLPDRDPAAGEIRLHVSRDAVHAGDDQIEGYHELWATRIVPGDVTALGETLAILLAVPGPEPFGLASVGDVPWVLHGYGAGGRAALAVVSDRVPRWLADPGIPLSALADADGEVSLHFEYRSRDDPHEVWEQLRYA